MPAASGPASCELTEVHRFPNGPVTPARRPLLGRPRPVPGHPRRAARAPVAATDGARSSDRHRHLGASTTACSTRTASCSATRAPTATTAPRGVDRRRCTPRIEPSQLYGDQRAAVPAVQHDLPAGRRAATCTTRGVRRLLHPGPPRLLAHRRARHRGHQRLDHRPARRPHRAVVAPSWSTASACPAESAAASRARRARSSAQLHARRARPSSGCRLGARHHGRLARHRVRGRRRARRRRPRFAYISCGTWALVGVELDATGPHRRRRRGELHQRARRRRHHPVPAQRHGPVAAVGDSAHLGTAEGQTHDLHRAARRGRRAAGRRPDRRRRRPGVPPARRHAGPDRRGLPATGAARRR